MITFRKNLRCRSPRCWGLERFGVGVFSVSLIAAVMVLSGCQTSQATEKAPSTQPPKPTDTFVPPATETSVPTKVPATETSVPTKVPATDTPLPTKVPTATPTSRPPLGPEQPALSIEQVAGRWLMKVMGEGEGDLAIFTLAEDGTHSTDAIGGYHAGMNLGTGTYWFDEDIMSLYSEDCTSPSTMFFTCTGTYRVFVAMAEDGPGALRFVAIEDPHPDRKKSLNNKTLYPAPPAEE